jgi:hypothetical protein
MTVARPAHPTVPHGEPSKANKVPLALCFMALDGDIPSTAMTTLRDLPFLQKVAKVRLE